MRPDYIHCIARTHVDYKNESWCGRNLKSEFHFMGIDHLAENKLQQGRLLGCDDCVDKIIKTISNKELSS